MVVWNGPPFFFVGIFVEKLTEVKIGFLVFVCVCVCCLLSKWRLFRKALAPSESPEAVLPPNHLANFWPSSSCEIIQLISIFPGWHSPTVELLKKKKKKKKMQISFQFIPVEKILEGGKRKIIRK